MKINLHKATFYLFFSFLTFFSIGINAGDIVK